MKKLLPFLSLAILGACNSNPKKELPASATQQLPAQKLDTSGFANYQDWKAQNEMAEIEEYNAPQKAAPIVREKKTYSAPVHKTAPMASAHRKKSASKRHTSTMSGSESPTGAKSSGGMNSEGSNAAKAPAEEKKGWSKTAKTTVIGAAGGAVLGAVINKKNRAAGAVIGGVLGGGVGYGLGKVIEKKEASKKSGTPSIY